HADLVEAILRGIQQRGPSVSARLVHIGAGFQQRLHRCQVSLAGRKDERREAAELLRTTLVPLGGRRKAIDGFLGLRDLLLQARPFNRLLLRRFLLLTRWRSVTLFLDGLTAQSGTVDELFDALAAGGRDVGL